MMTPETVAKWIGVAVAVGAVATPVVLFFSYRADYIRAGHPEATLLAFRLTLSSLKQVKRFKAGDVKHGHRRSGETAPHAHVRAEDMGTVNRPISELNLPPTPRRKTPEHPQRRKGEPDQ